MTFFKVLYDAEKENDQGKCFNNAFQRLNNIKTSFENNTIISEIYENNKYIFNKIKDFISNDESKAEIFIKEMVKYFKITDEKLISELTIILKSKKYEIDLKKINFFFQCLIFQNEQNKDNWINFDKYKDLSEMNLEELKKSLEDLKNNGVYDYEKTDNDYFFNLFTSLYDKKEAIDFLLVYKN